MPGLFGVPMWGENPALNAPLPGCDAANSVADVWYRLGFLDPADANVDDRWVTINELYQFADDAAKRLARLCSLYLTYDASIPVLEDGSPLLALQPGHVFTEGAWLVYAGAPLQLLRLSTVGQLFGLDANWPAATGDPVRLSLDAGPVGSATLYPSPRWPATLAQIAQLLPPDIVAGASSLPISPICQDYFSDAMIAAARSKESDSAMPEVAAHLAERMKLMEAVFAHLFGGPAP